MRRTVFMQFLMTFTGFPSPAVTVRFRMRGSEFFSAARTDEPPLRPVCLNPVTHRGFFPATFTKPFTDAFCFQNLTFKTQPLKTDGLPVFTVVGRRQVAVFKPINQLCPTEREAHFGRGFGELMPSSRQFVQHFRLKALLDGDF